MNYNQPELTSVMIESLGKISYPNVEIFVVDNASTQGNIRQVKQQYPHIHLLMSEKNLGFAGGNNLAFPHCRGKYILMLNNDTEVDPHFLEPMVEMLEADSSVGVVSPKLFFYDQPELLQFAGATNMHPVTLRGRKFGHKQPDDGRFDEVREIGFANGACLLFRTELLQEVGFMYEPYFLYYEEHDWVEMVRRAGYRIMFQPNSRIWHKVSASTGAQSPLKTHYLHRNRLVFIRRNRFGLTKLLALAYFWLLITPRELWRHRHASAHRQSIWRSIHWHLQHRRLPASPNVQLLSPVA